MDDITKIKRQNGRLKMQNELLTQKLYQACISHDHLSIKLQNAKVEMSPHDMHMVEATSRIVKAMSVEEVETIYSEITQEIFKKKQQKRPPSPPKTKTKKVVFFDDFTDISELFGFTEPTKSKNIPDTHKSLMDAIESLINGIDQQISNIESGNPNTDPDASNEQDSGDENDSAQEEPTSGFYYNNNDDFGDGFHNNDDVDEDDMDKTDDLKPPF